MGSEIVQIPQEEESAFKIPKGLEAVPWELWSSSGDDIGSLLSAEPVIIKTKGGSPPSIKQYPIADEAIPSIQKQIAVFLEKGILKECQSPYNTPILPKAIWLKIVCGILNICASNLQKTVTVHLYPNCNSVNTRLERCNTVNPTTLLLLPTDGEKDEHDCEQVIKMTSKPRDDLRDQPLDNPDMNLLTDGSSYYEEGWKCTGFAVTTETKVLLAGPLPPTLGAQGAEIVALTKAAQYAIGIRVNLYTDSKYAFGVCHATGMLWKERGFLTSAGKTITHGQQIKELLEAIQLPSELAVIYIKAHTNQENQLAKGNELADQAAKAAARQVIFAMTLTHQGELDLELPDMQKLYEELPEEERQLWEKLGAEQQNGQWTLGGKPLLPKRYLILIAMAP
ncbi:protein NYNRIN-like [Grus japonensis]|uniref:Protein NYNRIN-like n=1 Tax=Grus japonensis TaxID=30415 RepID=A0ABC9XC80_GRUJA